MRARTLILPLALLICTQVILFLRLHSGGIALADMYPEIDFLVELEIDMDLHGDPVDVRIFLPTTTETQTTRSERVETTHLSYSVAVEGPNRVGRWFGQDLHGHEVGIYRTIVDTHPTRFEIPEQVFPAVDYPDEVVRFLQSSPAIQSEAEEIRVRVRELLSPEGGSRPDIRTITRVLYDFVHEKIHDSEYENSVDALTALAWREAHCGGKSRLMVALLRASGIPARVVGGLILEPGTQKDSHLWAEAWINGVWVPFDALHGYFAEHPPHYLVLHRGDAVLVTRDQNINFQYAYKIKKWRRAPEENLVADQSGIYNSYVLWAEFRKAHISLNLLRIILMLPLGVLVVVLFRNIIGLRTFGTFMPALLAVALRDTGLVWGLALFLSVIVSGVAVRYLLEFIPLLHTPRLGLLLMFVVAFMLVITYFSVQIGVLEPAHISMFPIAILALTVENCYTKLQERGFLDTAKIVLATLLVVACAHIVMEHPTCQAVVFVFPEVLLTVAAAFLLLGRYVGLRLVELHRFRWLVGRQ